MSEPPTTDLCVAAHQSSPEIPTNPLAIIADDDSLGGMLLAACVTQAGLTPAYFSNGKLALDAALEHGASLVLLDVEMPEMDGYTVCRRLRADPRFSTVPIVMVTGRENQEAIELGFAAGATDFITKPVNWPLLSRRLEYIMRNAATAKRIEHLAYYDSLTGLANRQSCMETAEGQFAIARETGESVAVLYLDLNNFKRINDTFGHATGDVVLGTVSHRLQEAVKQFELNSSVMPIAHVSIARFGGDEFILLVRNADARVTALKLADACLRALSESIVCGGLEFYSTPSIGLAFYPDDGEDVTSVFKHADTAMYQAKLDAPVSVAAYEPAMSARLNGWLDLEAKLRHAIRDDQLYLNYQPKFSLTDGKIVGVEALARWCDKEYGEIPPDKFVKIAEESGFIMQLGAWSVRAACQQLRRWLDMGITLPVAINVSGKEILHGDPARVIEEAARAVGVPTTLIEVELTESVFINDSQTARRSIERIRQLGCRIALDDFGMGFSSLSYISRFPPDRLKIDKAFVLEVDRSASDAAVASAILTLGKNLNIKVTAEGAERPGQLEWLRERKCDEVQGFILAKPLAPTVLESRFFPKYAMSAGIQLKGNAVARATIV